MSEAVTTQAASSTADAVDVFHGQQPTMSEYSQYRATGELPERFKPAEEKPTDAQEETAEVTETEESETAPEPDPEEKQQEPPAKVSPAQKRILQLLAEKKDLERKLAATAQTDAKPDSSTVQPSQQPPQNYQDYRKAFKPSLFIEEYAKANPEASYEDANAAMADHLYDVRKHFDKIEERVRTESAALNAKVDEAKERYENFDEIKDAFLGKVLGDRGQPLIPVEVLEFINDSDNLADVIYALAVDPKALDEFVKLARTSKAQAIRFAARIDVGIEEHLKNAGNAEETQGTKAPVVKKTQAPKPPEPVTGVSSRAFDVNDDSLSADDWMRKRNQQIAKRS